MKNTLFVIIILLSYFSIFSQENQTQTLLRVKALQEKKIEYHKKTNGESDGYRVKIHFGVDKSKAEEVKSKFDSKFTHIPSYIDYQQPNWVIITGDFKTKLNAFEQLKKIKEEYPYAFIVKSKIKPQKLN